MNRGSFLANTARKVKWLETVLRREAVRARRKYQRWEQEMAASMTIVDRETGEEMEIDLSDPAAQADFMNAELCMWLDQLPAAERIILRNLYVDGLSQREVAQHLRISQKQVSRLHRRAINMRRRHIPQNT
ncbi:MAG: sigma-70 family RNA polymerase sigma factor [Coriobacteriia bacterium]